MTIIISLSNTIVLNLGIIDDCHGNNDAFETPLPFDGVFTNVTAINKKKEIQYVTYYKITIKAIMNAKTALDLYTILDFYMNYLLLISLSFPLFTFAKIKIRYFNI